MNTGSLWPGTEWKRGRERELGRESEEALRERVLERGRERIL